MGGLGAGGDYRDIAKAILTQMGGVNRISVMTNAKDFVALDSPEQGGVQFGFKGNAKTGNKFRVILGWDDLYTVEFWYVRGTTMKKIAEFDMIYGDQLKRIFEDHTGLRLSL